MRACLLLAVFALVAPNLAAQEWSPEQKEVLQWVNGIDWIDSYTEMGTSFDTYHPDFVAWQYSDEAPQGREAVAGWVADWVADHSSVAMEVKPLAIQVVGNLAILHLAYREETTDTSGATEAYLGRWTATALKEDGNWRFLAWTWLQTEPWPFGEKE